MFAWQLVLRRFMQDDCKWIIVTREDSISALEQTVRNNFTLWEEMKRDLVSVTRLGKIENSGQLELKG